MMSLLYFQNGTIVTPSGVLHDHHLTVEGKKITEIGRSANEMPKGSTTIDASGYTIVPGCIDLHCHGGGGADFLDPSVEGYRTVAQAHAQYGITSICATLAAGPHDLFRRCISTCEQVQHEGTAGATILGLHLEGNYLHPLMKGGMPEEYLMTPDPKDYLALLDSTGCILRWSISPELDGAIDFIRAITSRGVVASIAHTSADYSQIAAAVDAGSRLVTHFYNAMSGIHKCGVFKHEGAIESILLMDELNIELVADGIHVPPALIRLAHKVKGSDRIALVTDAMYAAAHPHPESVVGGRVIIEDDVCKLADRSAIYSSIASGNRLLKTIVQRVGLSLEEAVRMAAETPARLMGIEKRKGSLMVGKEADFLLLDDNLEVAMTVVEGQIVFTKESLRKKLLSERPD